MKGELIVAKVYGLLLDKNSSINGLRAIREKESELIDLNDWQNGIEQDATCSVTKQLIIKNDRVYSVRKTYFDLDKERRILLCEDVTETFDKLSETSE